MIIRPPTAEEIRPLLEMLTRAYVRYRPGFPDDPSQLAAYSDHDPNGGPDNWIVLWEDDRPLSALRLVGAERAFAALADGAGLDLSGVDQVKFRGQVVPDDRLIIVALMKEMRGKRRNVAEAQGFVNGQMVFEGVVNGIII